MTKRIIALFLVCILAVPLIALPASATGAYDEDILDVNTEIWQILDNWNRNLGGVGSTLSVMWQILEQLDIMVEEKLSEISSNITLYLDDVEDYLASIWTDIQDLTSSIPSWISAQTSAINDKLSTLQDNVVGTIADFINMVESKFDALLDGTSEDQTSADDLNQSQDDALTDYDDAMTDIQEATRPVIEDIDLDLSGYIPSAGVGTYGAVFKVLFSNSYIYAVFFCALTLSLVSYGIFGKR